MASAYQGHRIIFKGICGCGCALSCGAADVGICYVYPLAPSLVRPLPATSSSPPRWKECDFGTGWGITDRWESRSDLLALLFCVRVLITWSLPVDTEDME